MTENTAKQKHIIEDFGVRNGKLRIEITPDRGTTEVSCPPVDSKKTLNHAGSQPGNPRHLWGHPVALPAGVVESELFDENISMISFFQQHAKWDLLSDELQEYFKKYDLNEKSYERAVEKFNVISKIRRNQNVHPADKSSYISVGQYTAYLSGQPLEFGFDCEWYENDENERQVLSVQFSITIENVQYDFVFYDMKTVSLGECLYVLANRVFRDFGALLYYDGKKYHANPYFESCSITLIGHFSGVDYSMFSDWKELYNFKNMTYQEKKKYQKMLSDLKAAESKKNKTAKDKQDIEILKARVEKYPSTIRHRTNVIVQNKHVVFTTSPRVLNHWVRSHRLRCEFKIEMRDTMALAGAGTSLAGLGEAMGISKLDTTKLDIKNHKPVNFYKSNMNELLKDDFEFFMAYAIRDSRIAYEWYRHIVREYGDGVTISAIGAREALNHIGGAQGLQYSDVRGYTKLVDDRYPATRGKLGDLPSMCYIGGRNECFTFGHVKGESFDLDLRSAYPLAMMSIPEIDWSKTMKELNDGHVFTEADFDNTSAPGFGYVDFEFPATVKYPCIPDVVDGMPVFARTGRNVRANAPEIYAAVKLGAKVTVHGVFYFPVITKRTHPLGIAMRDLVEKRARVAKQYGKKSVYALLCKLINNSIYGKTGQGIHDKSVRNFIDDTMSEVGEARITDAVMASTITSVVRQLLALIMDHVDEQGYKVHTVTTDGFITDMPVHEHHKIDAHIKSVNPVFADIIKDTLVMDTTDTGSIIEVKHEHDADGFYNIKTRGNAGVNAGGVFAKAGYRGDDNFRFADADERRRMFINKYTNRKGRIRDEVNTMHSLYSLKTGTAKTLSKYFNSEEDKVKYLSLDPDSKRFIEYQNKAGYFESRPFENVAEHEKYKRQLKMFYGMGHNMIHDIDVRGLRYALMFGMPEQYKPVRPGAKLTKAEQAKATEEFKVYELKQALILLRRKEFINDPYVVNVLSNLPKERWEIVDELSNLQNIDYKKVENLYKNATKHKGFKFDYRTAVNAWDRIISVGHFKGLFE